MNYLEVMWLVNEGQCYVDQAIRNVKKEALQTFPAWVNYVSSAQ